MFFNFYFVKISNSSISISSFWSDAKFSKLFALLTFSIPYFITNDDCDGETHEGVTVIIDSQGDAWITVSGKKGYGTSRIRNFNGGGHNHRTRNALMILAEAIRLDNEERLDWDS